MYFAALDILSLLKYSPRIQEIYSVMRFAWILFLLAALDSCMPNISLSTSAAADTNIYNLSRLSVGMAQREVLKIMRHPYSDQTFEMDGDVYDVWFYVTEFTVLGQSRMMPANLTPLTFKNGTLIGWGHAYYNYLKKRCIEEERARIIPVAPSSLYKDQEIENINLEKILKETVPSKDQQSQLPANPTNTTPPISLPKRPISPSSQTPVEGKQKEAPKPSGAVQSPNTPNWSPLEKQPTPPASNQPPASQVPKTPSSQAPTKAQNKEAPKPSGAVQSPNTPNWSPLSMSRKSDPEDLQKPKKTNQEPAQSKSKPSIEEEDEDMIQQDSEQLFDQT